MTDENKDNIRQFRAPSKKAAPPPATRKTHRGPGEDKYTISTDKLIQLLISKMEDVHNDVTAVGHNTVVMEQYFNDVGDQLNSHSEALLHIFEGIEEIRTWIRHNDPTGGK